MAFGRTMSLEDLRLLVEGQRLPDTLTVDERLRAFFSDHDSGEPERPGPDHPEDDESGLPKLGDAWRELRDRADKGSLRLRGRFSPSYSLEDARLADVVALTGDTLATFSQFDVSTGGLRRQPQGSPDVLWEGHPDGFDREFAAFAGDQRAGDGYLLVEVEAVGLFANAGIAFKGRSPPVKAGRPPSDVAILAKADEMKSRGMNGRDIAKAMRLEAGFEAVATTHVRELIKGRYKSRGRPPGKGA
jgi:hypothetical protein